jgi:hypothetical protein
MSFEKGPLERTTRFMLDRGERETEIGRIVEEV